MIEAVGAKGPRVAGEFSEATNVRAIIHLVGLLGACRGSWEIRLTASSDDSLAGLFGSATMIFLSAWSKACEKSKGCDSNLRTRSE